MVRDPWWIRARRLVAVGALAVLTILGAVDVATTVLEWVRPSPAIVEPVAERLVEGVAAGVAVDYLSWDTDNRDRRRDALQRRSLPGRELDGWDGQGRQVADAPAVVSLGRSAAGRSVVAVRVRVTPYTPDSEAGSRTSGQPADPSTGQESRDGTGEGDPASGPVPTAPGGWRARPARWVVLAVPLVEHDHRLVLASVPALVGHPDTTTPDPMPADGQPTDEAFTRDTEQAARTFLDAVADGDIGFVRAPHARISTLDGSARLVEFRRWRGLTAGHGASAKHRVGVATVVWELAEQAGRLTCSYRVGLRRQDDRWLLTGMDIETGNTP